MADSKLTLGLVLDVLERDVHVVSKVVPKGDAASIELELLKPVDLGTPAGDVKAVVGLFDKATADNFKPGELPTPLKEAFAETANLSISLDNLHLKIEKDKPAEALYTVQFSARKKLADAGPVKVTGISFGVSNEGEQAEPAAAAPEAKPAAAKK